MELLSEFVDAPPLGACVTFYYRVVSMSLDTDSVPCHLRTGVLQDFISFFYFYFFFQFQLTQIDLSGSRHVLWSFTDSTKIGYWAWRPVTVFVPKMPSITAYRLSLSAKSANAGTYLGVRSSLLSKFSLTTEIVNIILFFLDTGTKLGLHHHRPWGVRPRHAHQQANYHHDDHRLAGENSQLRL